MTVFAGELNEVPRLNLRREIPVSILTDDLIKSIGLAALDVRAQSLGSGMGKHERVVFSFESINLEEMGDEMVSFFERYGFLKDGLGRGILITENYGYLDLIHGENGDVMQIVFQVCVRTKKGYLDITRRSFN